MSKRTTRRKFLKTTAAIGAGYFVAAGVTPRPSRAAVDTINFAAIGIGGKGQSDSADAGNSGNMVAICDIDEERLNQAAKRFTKAQKFFDYRKMLDDLDKSIDAVTVSTPDHNHAPASIKAMRMGKHCFCQKPLTHTIEEARLMGQIAKEKGVATQMGNQFTAHPNLRKAAAIIHAGALGTVEHVHVWTNRPVWPQGLDRPTDTPAVPSHVHWDEWLGPAPERPYHAAYHPFKWRGWWDFGTGALGDMACHTLNMPYMALKGLRDPVSVQAETSGHNKETYPKWSIINYEFPMGLKFTWYDGGKRPAQELIGEHKMDSSGSLLIGTKGAMYAPGDYAEKGLFYIGGAKEPEVEWTRSPGHFEEWVNAIKGGEPAVSNFPGFAGPLTEVVLLGNLAVFAASEEGQGKKIEWDAENLKTTNAPEVEHIVRKQYRKGYDVHTI